MVEAQGSAEDALAKTFADYCGAGHDTMDGKAFVKLAKDCKLLDKKLTTTDVDLIFSKVKERTVRRINLNQFMDALQQFATKKGVDVNEVAGKVAASQGPILRGTATEAVRLHDDQSTYTGVYA